MTRYCQKFIEKDLSKKMVFLGGPRQVGKTTLSKHLGKAGFPSFQYFNWDNDEDRQAILQKEWLNDSKLIIFDELHKYHNWKQWLKGVYDTRPGKQQYLVTGSARLDIYRQGGDSLLGRNHYWRLHPFTLDELPDGISKEDAYQRLLTLGGFPEPFLANDEREARRWRRERFDRVLKEDVRDLALIKDIQLLQLFVDALRARVGGLVTLSNLARDLQISPKTAKAWLQLVERMYLAFAIYPCINNIPRAIQKPPKVFFYDNADVIGDEGSRLENLVATHLQKRLHFIEDYHGYRCELQYIRDKESREVDFITLIDGEVHDLIEVKLSDTSISTALQYYKERLKPKRTTQIVGTLKRPFNKGDILVTNPIHYFQNAPWDI
jgi:predicted AAA+ superfamily ATPase